MHMILDRSKVKLTQLRTRAMDSVVRLSALLNSKDAIHLHSKVAFWPIHPVVVKTARTNEGGREGEGEGGKQEGESNINNYQFELFEFRYSNTAILLSKQCPRVL